MKKITRLLALLLALLMCVPALAETAANANDVVVTVNGVTATRDQLQGYIESVRSYYLGMGYDDSYMTVYQQLGVETLVEYMVMDQLIAEKGLTLTDEEKAAAEADARAEWNAVVNDGMSYYGITDASTEEERSAVKVTVLGELEAAGYTEESYVAEMVGSAVYDKLVDEVIKDVTVSDEQVQAHFDELVAADEAAYKNNAAAYEETQYMNTMYAMYGMNDYVVDIYYMPDGYRAVTHILLTADEALMTAYQELEARFEEQQSTLEEGGEVTETLVTVEEVEAARLAVIASVQPTLDEINAKLAEGTPFAELIPLYSQDPGMQDAAAIAEGYAVHMDSVNWDPVFRDAAFTVDNLGDITAPVVGAYGVHILQYDHDVVGGPLKMTDELRAALHDELLSTAQYNAYRAVIDAAVASAEIVYAEDIAAIVAPAADEAAE